MNRQRYKLVFNRHRGQLMAVAEIASSIQHHGRTSAHAAAMPDLLPSALRFSLLAIALALAMNTVAHAQILGDRNAPRNQQPTVLVTPNGVPVVNIQTPSTAGVSVNSYRQFDVGPNGAILNNAQGTTSTQLGGYVAGNPWLATGAARVIVNQVNSANPSYLRGYLEVAGARAQVVVANPAGITCSGCGFINANRATLTTGVPQVVNGNLESYRVASGAVRIEGNGLDASRTDYAEIIARAVQVNAGVLNEPTAAALAYGIHQREGETKFLVVDLGGGTFDVSVLDLFEGVMEVRATAGDNFLGGEDFVQAIVDAFCREHDISDKLRNEPRFAQLLHARAEQAKRTLSESPGATLAFDYDGRHYEMALDEARLDTLCAPLLARLRAPVERALRDAAIPLDELDSVVLAGGATRMPIVRKMIARMFGRFPAIDLNPDEVVALGAAVQAGLKMRDQALKEVVMTDVAPYSMGVEVAMQLGDGSRSSGHMDPVIERNTTVPVSKVKTYFPTSPQQTKVDLNIFQGEARLTRDNIYLGTLCISDEGRPLGQQPIDVRFTYDVNGLLQIDAVAHGSGTSYNLLIESAPGLLDEDEIAASLARLAGLKIHPRDRLQYRTLLARAERLYQQLRGDTRQWLGMQITGYEQVLDSQDSERIAAQTRQFTELLDHVERQATIFLPNGEAP